METSNAVSQNCNGWFRGNTLTKWVAPMAAGMITSLSSAAPAAAACQLLQVAELDVTVQNNTPVVPVTIDGQSVQMILDTSYSRTQMSRSAARDLHLKLKPSVIAFYGPDGVVDGADMASVRDFTFAGATTHQFSFYVTGQVASTGNVVGVIGEDILSHFDIEFDLRSSKVRFFVPKDCKGDQVAYWTHDYFVVDLSHTRETDLPLFDVMLNGQKVLATFSSGTPQSAVTTQAVQTSGIKPESAVQAAGTVQGVTGKPINSSVVVFPSLTIGQETLQNAKLRIAGPFSRYGMERFESQLEHHAFVEPDLEIGGDFFLAHRIYLARSQKKIYFTYNGGPIFQTAAPSTSPPPSDISQGEASRHNP
jgi:Aspartyl protease